MLLRGQAKKSHRIKEIWLVSLPPRIRNCWTAEKCDHHLEIGNCRELLHGKALSSIYKKILMTLPPFFFILGIQWRSSGVPKWTNMRYDSVVQKGLNLNNYINLPDQIWIPPICIFGAEAVADIWKMKEKKQEKILSLKGGYHFKCSLRWLLWHRVVKYQTSPYIMLRSFWRDVRAENRTLVLHIRKW